MNYTKQQLLAMTIFEVKAIHDEAWELTKLANAILAYKRFDNG